MKASILPTSIFVFSVMSLLTSMVIPVWCVNDGLGVPPSLYKASTLTGVQAELADLQSHNASINGLPGSEATSERMTSAAEFFNEQTNQENNGDGSLVLTPLVVCPKGYSLNGTICESYTKDRKHRLLVHTLLYYNGDGTQRLFNSLSGNGMVSLIHQWVSPLKVGAAARRLYVNEFVTAEQFKGEVAAILARKGTITYQTPDDDNARDQYQIQFY